jgi:uncharacterized protein
MAAIYIPNLLKAPQQTETLPIEDFIEGINSLSPVKGFLKIAHRGTYLEVSIQAKTILTLTCDRCLQQYNHRLSLNTSELLWLDENAGDHDYLLLDKDLCEENLSESVSPDGYFDAYKWLYEQLSLALPLRQLCGKDCQPPEISQPNEILQDSRWSALASLKDQLN